MMPGLRYIGVDRSTDWLPGVPARDLTAAEVKRWPEAAESAFYTAEAKGEKKPARRPVRPETDNQPEAGATAPSPAEAGEPEQE